MNLPFQFDDLRVFCLAARKARFAATAVAFAAVVLSGRFETKAPSRQAASAAVQPAPPTGSEGRASRRRAE